MKRSLGFESADEDEELDAGAVRVRAGPGRVLGGRKRGQGAGQGAQDGQDEVDYLTIEIADDRGRPASRGHPPASRTREADVLRQAMPRGLRMMEKMGFKMGQKLGKEGNRNGLLSPLGAGGRGFSRETPLDEHAFSDFVQGMNLKSELRRRRGVLDGMRRVWLGFEQSETAKEAGSIRAGQSTAGSIPAGGKIEQSTAETAKKAEPTEQSTAGSIPAGGKIGAIDKPRMSPAGAGLVEVKPVENPAGKSISHSALTEQSRPAEPASIEHSKPAKHSSPAGYAPVQSEPPGEFNAESPVQSEPAGEFNPAEDNQAGHSNPAEKSKSTQQSKAEPARSALQSSNNPVKQSTPAEYNPADAEPHNPSEKPPQSPQTQLNELNQQIDTLNNQLRTEFSYCYFCGAQYESQHELAELCPGTQQSSHY